MAADATEDMADFSAYESVVFSSISRRWTIPVKAARSAILWTRSPSLLGRRDLGRENGLRHRAVRRDETDVSSQVQAVQRWHAGARPLGAILVDTETRLFITSSEMEAERLPPFVRGH
jgi:hypothetical protein